MWMAICRPGGPLVVTTPPTSSTVRPGAPSNVMKLVPVAAGIVTESAFCVIAGSGSHAAPRFKNGSNNSRCSRLAATSHASPTPSPSVSRWSSAICGHTSHASSKPSASSSWPTGFVHAPGSASADPLGFNGSKNNLPQPLTASMTSSRRANACIIPRRGGARRPPSLRRAAAESQVLHQYVRHAQLRRGIEHVAGLVLERRAPQREHALDADTMPPDQREHAADPRELDNLAALVEVRAIDKEALRARVHHAEAAPREPREQQLRRAIPAVVVALGHLLRLRHLAAGCAERNRADHTRALKKV